jgi:hypothetical protein
LRSETFATGLEPFIAPRTFHKVRNLSSIEPMKSPNRSISSRKDRGIAAASLFALMLGFGLCHATYAQQASPDQSQKNPQQQPKAPPPPPEAQPKGDPKTGVLKPPDVDPKMAKQVPDVDPAMNQPPPDKQQPADQAPPKVQPK